MDDKPDKSDEVDYLLQRARQEQANAAAAEKPQAAAAHRELAMRYSIKAFQWNAHDEEPQRDERGNSDSED